MSHDGLALPREPLAHPWQPWLLKLALMLLLLYLPFGAPIAATSSQYPSAAHVLPFVNLGLAAIALPVFGVEILSARHLPFSWFSFTLIAGVSLLAIIFDSLAHILGIFQLLYLPTLDKLPQPLTENLLEIGALIWVIVTTIPFAWASMRARQREKDLPRRTDDS